MLRGFLNFLILLLIPSASFKLNSLEFKSYNSYVIISKIDPGNVSVKPIPINPITIRDRFRKIIGKVDYLKF
jgi:hypothetical protein